MSILLTLKIFTLSFPRWNQMNNNLGFKQSVLNPLTPTSDQDRISLYNIYTPFSVQCSYTIDGNKKNISVNLGIISWSDAKLSQLTLLEVYGWQ